MKTPRTIPAGRILSGLAIAFLAVDAAMKLAVPETAIKYSPPLGLANDPGLMPTVSNTLFGVYVGALFWLGYWLRDARVRALLS